MNSASKTVDVGMLYASHRKNSIQDGKLLVWTGREHGLSRGDLSESLYNRIALAGFPAQGITGENSRALNGMCTKLLICVEIVDPRPRVTRFSCHIPASFAIHCNASNFVFEIHLL